MMANVHIGMFSVANYGSEPCGDGSRSCQTKDAGNIFILSV